MGYWEMCFAGKDFAESTETENGNGNTETETQKALRMLTSALVKIDWTQSLTYLSIYIFFSFIYYQG